ncbi:hypothetical protein OF829_13420 [Sphingomonas sp. LB-2]|uniref:hypothetical protein n=1 Tax=Sphingomonas caeni TaxID=2984949 RepID=UPI00222F1C1A|nr:hypothetical protein [Sphingomonas caeni]MCW3848240.1 hypothetical protein [Sphingomonas caeni]
MISFDKRALMIGAAVLGMGVLDAAPAYAQATRTWVSGVGDDANPCSRTAPCKTFAGAISKTAAGGEINCLDPGGFGAVTITKSMSIICDYTEGGVLNTGFNGVIINAADTDVVTLSGLDILALQSNPGTNGITFLNGAGLHVRNTTIKGQGTQGISFTPGVGKTSFLNLDNVVVQDSGTSGNATTGAIKIAPGNSGTATVTITNSRVTANANAGLRLDLTGTTGTKINAQVSNSTFSNSAVGMLIKAPAGTGTINMSVTNTIVANNGNNGVFGNGSGVSARFATTTITNNGSSAAGVSAGVTAANSAAVQSYGNNFLNGNFNNAAAAADGAFSGPVAQQ